MLNALDAPPCASSHVVTFPRSRSTSGVSRSPFTMSPLLIKISKDFATIWTTIDPIGNLAIFAALTASLTRTERRRTALRATIYATVILVVAVVAGQIILDAIGIHLHSLKVAGGIILFLFGLQMLFGRMDAEVKAVAPEAGRDLAVFPLAVPSIAGPGAMMAVILLTDNDVYTVAEQPQTGVVLLVVLLFTYILLLFSDAILRIIGRQGAAILVRVMGIILASLAVEIVLTALGGARGAPVWPWSLFRCFGSLGSLFAKLDSKRESRPKTRNSVPRNFRNRVFDVHVFDRSLTERCKPFLLDE